MKKNTYLKTLVVEGAGWEKAEGTNDVTNCRIRTRIRTNEGLVYFEAAQDCEGYGRVWHCHFEDNDNSRFRKFENEGFPWTKYGIIKFVNAMAQTNFNMLEVVNDGSVAVHRTEEALCD